jgi:hypothetical protein
VPNPKLSTLVDAFTAGSINATLWNNVTPGAATLDTVNDLVTLAVGTTNGTFNNFATNGPYDATGSSIYAQVTAPPNGNGGITTYLKLQADANNLIQIQLASGGAFSVFTRNAGTWTGTNLPTYDPHQHRWWRLREVGGSFAVDASPDGYNWATLATVAYTWSPTAVSVWFQTGTSDTEPSGMVATIENVNTMLGGPVNPNWPTVEDAWGPLWNAGGGAVPADRYVSVTDRTRGNVGVTRGRQYETDQVRSGEATLTLANPDGALDPGNATGPWAGHVLPYQPYKRRAQWPPTRNLLTQAQATGGDVGGLAAGPIPGGINVFSDSDATGGSIVATSGAWQGGSVFQFAVASAAASNTRIGYTNQVAVTPGQTYTVQLRVRNVTASASVSVQPHVAYYGSTPGAAPSTFVYGGTVVLTGSATAPWSLVTVTATVPASAYGVSVGVSTAATVAAACSVQVDGWQAEKGATASTWTCPGVWNPVYAGFTERWSSSWDMGGTYGLATPTGVDALSLLSQQQLSDSLTEEINSHKPRFVYKLDDPAGSMSVADATGTYPALPLAVSKYGAGSMTFGNAITSTSATGTYAGSAGTVATIANANPGTATVSAATYLNLTGAGIAGPARAALWSRMIAFRYTGPTPTATACVWGSDGGSGFNGIASSIRFEITTSGVLQATITSSFNGISRTLVFGSGAGLAVTDGNWHLAVLSFDSTGGLGPMLGSVDGQSSSGTTSGTPNGITSDYIGTLLNSSTGNTTNNFKGDISFVAEFPTALTNTDMVNLYAAWKSACAGDSTDARYSRILRYAGYTGPSSVQTGLTTSMGPAAIDGQDAVSALQGVVDTEGGAHYVDRAGVITFRARSARYNATVPVFVFGEKGDLGEWPYEDCQLDFDSTHLSNQVTVTQESSQQAFYANDATSTTAYFPRTMTRTVNSNSTLECQDAANYLLSRYRQPATRVSGIKLHPSANPAMWPVCLALELGTRVRVMRRPNGAPASIIECFVENIVWDFSDTGDATVTLQCSPADTTPYAVFAAWHTTLATTIAPGVTSITVNASQDTVNPLAAQLGPGQQIVLSQGTANQETVTVQAVGATSSGWTTAVMTLTAATTKAHTAGDLVNEPLPAGVTDPATYDASSKFDSTAFAY